jgi:hypothetical protein
VSEITKSAWNQLKMGGHSKNFDVVPVKKNVVSFKVDPTEPETKESTEQTESTEIEKPKRKSTKSNEQ